MADKPRKRVKAPPDHPRIPQPHGGALLRGAVPGNPGGGRKPSALRQRLTESFEQSIGVLEEFRDGTVTVHLRQVCEHCGKEPTKQTVDDILRLVPSGSDRLRAIDLMGKYGPGAVKEVSYDTVRDRLRDTIEIIHRMAPPDVAVAILDALEGVWRE